MTIFLAKHHILLEGIPGWLLGQVGETSPHLMLSGAVLGEDVCSLQGGWASLTFGRGFSEWPQEVCGGVLSTWRGNGAV